MQLPKGIQLQNGKYTILDTLGQGGFGITYKALMIVDDVETTVAIKEFFMKDSCERDATTHNVTVPTAGNRELVQQCRVKFVKEAENIRNLSHASIVRVYDVFSENNTDYYVMQYLGGGSLSDLVKRNGPLDEGSAINYIDQVGAALEYMHGKRMCHLDVKPANILLDGAGFAKLIDFGISKNYDESGNATSMTPIGVSQGYAPMEQYTQQSMQAFSPESDIYSLGATLYKLITGNTPPEATLVISSGIGEKPDNVSPSTWEAIVNAMRPNPKERQKSVMEFLNQLHGIMPLPNLEAAQPNTQYDATDYSAPVVAPTLEQKPEPKKSNSKGWLIGILAALLIGAIAAGAYFILNNDSGRRSSGRSKDSDSSKVKKKKEKDAKSEEVVSIEPSYEVPDEKMERQGFDESYYLNDTWSAPIPASSDVASSILQMLGEYSCARTCYGMTSQDHFRYYTAKSAGSGLKQIKTSSGGYDYQFFFNASDDMISGVAISCYVNNPQAVCAQLDNYLGTSRGVMHHTSENCLISPGYANGKVYLYYFYSNAPDPNPAPRK